VNASFLNHYLAGPASSYGFLEGTRNTIPIYLATAATTATASARADGIVIVNSLYWRYYLFDQHLF